MSPSQTRAALAALSASLLGGCALALLAAPSEAEAYAWTVGHGYTSCAACHTDPSGAGLLTEYGRAQGEIFVRTQWEERDVDWEPGAAASFAYGAVELPEWLIAGASFRGGPARVATQGSAAVFPVPMQADLRAQVTLGPVRGYASLGVLPVGAESAKINRGTRVNILSREHWVGVDPTEDLVIRAGRIALPYGNRILEHTAWARTATRTDINADQQHGVDVHWASGDLRVELMGIAGNMQLSPKEFRETGYSGLVEYSLGPKMVLGVSSLVTTADLDIQTLAPRTRQAHGMQLRVSPLQDLVVLAEASVLLDKSGADSSFGTVGWVQGDYQIMQGLHAQVAGEWLQREVGTSVGAWAGGTWFFASHVDARMDYIYRQTATSSGSTPSHMVLGQLHFYL